METKLNEHLEEDAKFQLAVIEDISEIKNDIRIIKENHLVHIQVDLAWVKKILFSFVAAFGTIVTSILIAFLLGKI